MDDISIKFRKNKGRVAGSSSYSCGEQSRDQTDKLIHTVGSNCLPLPNIVSSDASLAARDQAW